MFKSAKWSQLEVEVAMMEKIAKMGIAFDETLKVGDFNHPRYYDSDIIIYRGNTCHNIDLKNAGKGSFASKTLRVASLMKLDGNPHHYKEHYFDENKRQYRTYCKSANSLISTWYRLFNHSMSLQAHGIKSFKLSEFVSEFDYLALTLAFNSQCVNQTFKTDLYAVEIDDEIYMISSKDMKKYVTVYVRGLPNKPLEHEPQVVVNGKLQNYALNFKVLASDLKKDIKKGLYKTIRQWYL